MTNLQQPKITPLMVSSWVDYARVVNTFAKDFELELAINEECRIYNARTNQIAAILWEKHTNMQRHYCVKTGQVIGVVFSAGKTGLAASIASQWVLTGEDALKKHSEETPIAYTVYLLGKVLAMGENNTLAGMKALLQLKVSTYALLIDCASSTQLTLFQTALRLMANPALVQPWQFPALLREFERMDIDSSNLETWSATVLASVYKFEMPHVINADEYERLENRIYNREQTAIAQFSNKSVSLGLSTDKAFLNVAANAKAKAERTMKTEAKKAATSKVSELLGNLLGGV